MDSFTYEPVHGRVVFGAGASTSRLAPELERLGARRVLLISAEPELAEPIHDLAVAVFADVRPHVPVEVARAAVAAARAAEADWLVSVGGGSATGIAKAVALELGLPIAAVPTTYAGSEMTAIYGMTDGGRKRTGSSPAVVPRLVVYDPDLLATLAEPVAAASAMNALAHAVEALYGPGANPVTALLAEEAIRELASGLDRGDASTTLWGAYLAASALAVAGTGLHHRVCHVLGGAYDLPHAALNAVVLPHAVDVVDEPRALARVATALGARDAASGLRDLAAGLPVPQTLEELGLHDVEAAAALLRETIGADGEEVLRRAVESSAARRA